MIDLSCTKCGNPAKKGSFNAWQVLIAILFFPIGLLALLADKKPSVCLSCGHSWQG